MGSRIIHFIKYNNAFTLALGFLLLSTGTIFAANEDVRATLIDSEETIVSVDNSYIRTVDLDTFDPALQIVEITEDDINFFVTYRFNTIQVIDGVWTAVSSEELLTVPKASLGERDLGLYVAEELQEVAESHLAHLREVQTIEQSIGSMSRAVQTEYSGLIGSLFDTNEASFIGYTPVIPEDKLPVAGVLPENIDDSKASKDPLDPMPSDTNDPTTPHITLIGSSTMEVALESEFLDPGATAVDDIDGDLTDSITREGVVDISSSGTYTLTYNVSDSSENTTSVTRLVIVTEPTQVSDLIAPLITLVGSSETTVTVGEIYSELGATALDDRDGDITDEISTASDVNEAQVGVYTVTYTVTDAAGNPTSEVRTVTVTEAMPPQEPVLE